MNIKDCEGCAFTGFEMGLFIGAKPADPNNIRMNEDNDMLISTFSKGMDTMQIIALLKVTLATFEKQNKEDLDNLNKLYEGNKE